MSRYQPSGTDLDLWANEIPPKYQIRVRGSWLTVTAWIFYSWTGGRRKNGLKFYGKVYCLGDTPDWKLDG